MKTILITGASTGIGEALATVFANQGWNVIATMRNPSAAGELSQRGNVLVARLDVQDPESIQAAIEAGIQKFGGIDLLLNNAGINVPGIFESVPADRAKEIFAVNVLGVMDTIRAILPHFRERKGGVIVNISSASGVIALPLISLYNASKFALEGFSESLSYELLSQNIVVKLIEPGLVKTKMTASWLDETSANTVPDYDSYVKDVLSVYSGMASGEIPEAAPVAQTIFEAATDGTDRLRYIVTEGAEQLIQSRYVQSEEEYVRSMREMFQPK